MIFVGIATPTEAAATGALGSIILATIYGRMNLGILKKSITGTLHVTVMAFMIIGVSSTYSGILAYTGATSELVDLINSIEMSRIAVLLAMMFILLVMGTFMDQVSMMMLTIPVYMPIIYGLNLDPIWFAILMLLNLEMAMSTPPFGFLLFVMKGTAPTETTMGEIIEAAYPFLICDAIVMIVLLYFPSIVTFLPNLM